MASPEISELTRSFVLDSFESASMRVTKDWYTIYSPFIILIFFLVFFFAFAIGSLLALFINWDTIKKFFMILSKICNFFIKIILLINVLHIINFIYQVDIKCFNPNSSDKEVIVLNKEMVGGGRWRRRGRRRRRRRGEWRRRRGRRRRRGEWRRQRGRRGRRRREGRGRRRRRRGWGYQQLLLHCFRVYFFLYHHYSIY